MEKSFSVWKKRQSSDHNWPFASLKKPTKTGDARLKKEGAHSRPFYLFSL
jgi:hypothetical protein